MRAAIVFGLSALAIGCGAHAPSADSPPVVSREGATAPSGATPERSAPCATLRPAGRVAPSFDALRAVLGHARDDAELDALRAKLGTSKVGDDARGGVAEEFREAGVTWSFLDRAHLSAISLDGRVGASARYAAPLPRGLAFTMSKADVAPTLAASQPCDLGLPCDATYPEEGLALTYEGGHECLARVELFAPLAADELRIEAMSTHKATMDGETGARVTFFVRRGATEPRVVEGALSFETTDGRAVATRSSTANARPAALSVVQRQDHRGPIAPVTFFVPYRDVGLAPGAHELIARLAVGDLGKITYGSPSAATAPLRALHVTPREGSPPRLTLTMPPVRTVRVAVESAEVAEGVYDDVTRTEILAALGTGGASLVIAPPPLVEKARARLSKPDLTFYLGVGARQHFHSSARQDTFTATWRETSPPFFAADEDLIWVCVGDEDFTPLGKKDERIGCIRGSADELRERAKAGRLTGSERLKSAALRITASP